MAIKQNLRLFIFETCAAIVASLTLIFSFIPAYFEDGKADLSLAQMAFGVEDRMPTNGLLVFGFILVLIGVIVSIAMVTLLVLKENRKIEIPLTIGGIIGGLSILAGAIILATAIFATGMNEVNSSLGFTQGNWGIRIGNILTPIAGLIAFILSYPCALVILHRKDEEDKKIK